MPTALEQSIYNTVRYFDLFSMPRTPVQIWQCLIVERTELEQHPSLYEIQDTLHNSSWLAAHLEYRDGYYSLAGRKHVLPAWLMRHARAQQKWKIARRTARWLASVPFVRALAGSGSLAVDNTSADSDLDMFAVTCSRRIWTARAGLLAMAQLFGKRRRHWDEKAPDKVCLNHYVTDNALEVPREIRNLYTSVQYVLHVPVFAPRELGRFRRANAWWMRSYVSIPALPDAGHAYTIARPRLVRAALEWIEGLLAEPAGDVLEGALKRLQVRSIIGHGVSHRAGRVHISDRELAFHPDTKVPALLARYYQRQS